MVKSWYLCAMKGFVTFLLVFLGSDLFAQCAMCKAQLESSDLETGSGINDGIFFLMIIPYILLMLLVVIFFNGRIRSSFIRFFNS